MCILTPRHIFKDITRITPEFLQQQGIRALVLDVDNTLTAHGSQEVTPEVEAWLAGMRAAGVRMMIASNNVKKRVAPFAGRLGLSYVSFCCKPSPWWLWAARRAWHLPKKQVALVGDQVFTDLLAGTLWGARVLLVQPMYADIKWSIRLKRRLEEPFLRRYYKKGGTLL